MEIRNCGKRYKIIKVLNDCNAGHMIKWSPSLIYDVEENRVIIRLLDGCDYWIDLTVYVKICSWPFGRTGPWPDYYKCLTKISEEEMKEINENTVDFIDFEKNL